MVSSEIIALQAIDKVNFELRERNEIRVASCKARLGERYLLHPMHSPSRTPHRFVNVLTAE